MQEKPGFAGVIAPVLTPFGEDGNPDAERFVDVVHRIGIEPFKRNVYARPDQAPAAGRVLAAA